MFVTVSRPPGGVWISMSPSPDVFCLTLATSNVGAASCAATIATAAITQTANVSFLIALASPLRESLYLICLRSLDAVDDQDLNRSSCGFEFEPELLLECSEHRSCVGIDAGLLTEIGRILQGEVVFARQTGFVSHR